MRADHGSAVEKWASVGRQSEFFSVGIGMGTVPLIVIFAVHAAAQPHGFDVKNLHRKR
jgi:hypothetical protein